jgi:hypothetical protein
MPIKLDRKEILEIAKNLIKSYDDKKILFLYKLKNLKNINNRTKLIIFFGNCKFVDILKIYSFLYKKKLRFKKNFFILAETKGYIIGHNFIPDWPYYNKEPFIIKFYSWFKKFILIFDKNKNFQAIYITKY